jgi:carnitine O-acetyltransferase
MIGIDLLIYNCPFPTVVASLTATRDFTELTSNNALHVLSFQGYGSNFIKHAGFSPDAFVQVAMQLATYRLWGKQAGTYEATQVRLFLHGRTETTRSVSAESAVFVHRLGLRPALDEHDASVRAEKMRLLHDAVNAHVQYIGQSAQAQGVDRHFLGLSLLVKDGETLPDLYSDPVFQRSKRWRVSTSHLTHPKFDGWGYGQVVPDGVGLAYSIHPRHCIFNITALKETGCTDKLSALLEEAMLELRTLVELEKPQVSKL